MKGYVSWSYSKDGVDKDGKIFVLTIEKILKLLIDKESGAKISAVSMFIILVFKVFQEIFKKSKEKESSSKSKEKDYTHYLRNNHNSFSC